MVKGQPLNMKLDARSSVSIISDTLYIQNLSDIPLQKTKLNLKTFTGENNNPLGTVCIPVTLKEQQ